VEQGQAHNAAWQLSHDALRAATPTPVSAAAAYSGMAAVGLEYAPAFR
jgi:hypothetical protein